MVQDCFRASAVTPQSFAGHKILIATNPDLSYRRLSRYFYRFATAMCNDTETVANTTAIEAEADDYAYDSGFGEDFNSSTASIGSSIMKYREENGRTYHAYKEGIYAFPNDDPEADRLDLQHHLYNLTFEGKLFTAPIPKEKKFNRVLDVGTGTGIWAIDFGDEHPEATVLGIDLSPSRSPLYILRTCIGPLNRYACQFLIDHSSTTKLHPTKCHFSD